MNEAQDLKSLLLIRDYQASDHNFIYASWLNGLYYGNRWNPKVQRVRGAPLDFYSSIDKDTFMLNYHKVLDKLLSKPSVLITVAALKEDPEVAVGYAVTEKPVFHWIFVKEPWRKMGVGSMLVNLSDYDCYTHLTKVGWSTKPRHWQFNPWKLGV